MYVEVILPLAIEGCLTYSVPQSLEARVRCEGGGEPTAHQDLHGDNIDGSQ